MEAWQAAHTDRLRALELPSSLWPELYAALHTATAEPLEQCEPGVRVRPGCRSQHLRVAEVEDVLTLREAASGRVRGVWSRGVPVGQAQDLLVLATSALAMRAHGLMRGRHSKKTSAFVKACLAYCHVTVPSVSDPARRLELEPRVRERRRQWREELGDSPIRHVEQTLLKPLDYGKPLPNFGLAAEGVAA